MGFTKLELVQFFDGLTELVSEENRGKASVQIRKFLLEFEKRYQYEDAVMQRNVPYIPPYYIPAMPQAVQEEIREKLVAKLAEQGENTPEQVEQFMRSQIYDLKGLIDIKEYVEWVDKEIYRNFERGWKQAGDRKPPMTGCVRFLHSRPHNSRRQFFVEGGLWNDGGRA